MADQEGRKKKTNIWTEGVFSVLGRPVQIWKKAMQQAVHMADEQTKSIPGGLFDKFDLNENEKGLLLLCAGIAAGAIATVATAITGPSAVFGAAVAILAIGGIGTEAGPAAGAAAGVTAAASAGVAITGAFLGLSIIPAVGLGIATFGLVGAPRMAAKALYLAPKAVTSILDAAMLGLPSGAAQSMRAVGKSIKSAIKRKPKPKSQPKSVANDDQGQNCPTCVQTQQQVSELTQKVQGLEEKFAQSGAKPESRRTRPTAKKTSSRTVKQ